jgi:tRNA-2-methylthio-N6-dimethylallyladenosine synthase
MLIGQGYRLTTELKDADVIFINTCAVRDKAEQKVFSFLGRLRGLKVRKPGIKILLAGCIAQQQGDRLLKRFHHLDLVLGTRSLAALPNLIEKIQEDGLRLAHLAEEEDTADTNHDGCLTVVRGVAAPITIMQGCDNYCSYCIVPYVRGSESSRPSGAILKEINALVTAGVCEVTLLGQNVNSYGRKPSGELSFSGLLGKIRRKRRSSACGLPPILRTLPRSSCGASWTSHACATTCIYRSRLALTAF